MISTSEPHSSKELVAVAEDFEFFSQQPLKSWLRSAKVLLSQAAISEREGDIQLAFVYTLRYVSLVSDKLRQYSSTERASVKDELRQATIRLRECMPKLETWKPIINARYERYIQAQATRRAALEDPDPDEDDTHEHVDIAENKELAVQLMQATRRLVEGDRTKAEPDSQKHAYNYPQVSARASPAVRTSSTPRMPAFESSPPEIPSKLGLSLPRVPAKLDYSSPPILPVQEPSSQIKFKINAYTEGGQGLRTVMLPASLQQKFLNIADKNTARSLETCGVLGATLVSNALIITHLIIPDQTSTSDTCDTTEPGDVALFDYCEQQNLISCGWIHTHPSQTCFLSSRDLHTSAGYQQMLPEAIAIVCAPRHNPSIGIFRLTSPPGLPAILKCQTPGLFHLHAEQNLYTDAASPGHVIEDSKLDFTIVDLRR